MLSAFRVTTVVVCAVVCFAVTFSASGQEAKFAVKTAKSEPPKDLDESIRKLLPSESILFQDASGKTVAEFWFRAAIPTDATPEQVKNGVTYREVKQTELFGAVRFEQNYTDYRQQKVKAGVYTLRLGYQPMDGDHAGKSPHLEFLVATEAKRDTKAGILDFKKMFEASAASINAGHAGIFMLFPGKAVDAPEFVSKANNHWALQTKSDVLAGGKKTGTSLGIAVTLVGHAEE
jgi:hypothetical protein